MSSTTNAPGRHPLAGTAPDTVLAAEDAIRPLLFETAIWFDFQGNEIGRRSGTTADVTFTAAEATSMKGAIFTRNHPDGWNYPMTDPRRAGNSFSDDDVALAVRVDVAELRVVTPRLRFSLKRPVIGWGIEPLFARMLHALYEQVAGAELDIAVSSGRLILEEKDAALYHVVVERLARQFGFKYARWEG